MESQSLIDSESHSESQSVQQLDCDKLGSVVIVSVGTVLGPPLGLTSILEDIGGSVRVTLVSQVGNMVGNKVESALAMTDSSTVGNTLGTTLDCTE